MTRPDLPFRRVTRAAYAEAYTAALTEFFGEYTPCDDLPEDAHFYLDEDNRNGYVILFSGYRYSRPFYDFGYEVAGTR